MSVSTTNHGRGRPCDEQLRARRREEILAVAAKFFAERGYSDANTQELANLLQVGKGTIYRYFPTKQAVFRAALDRLVAKLKEFVDAAAVARSDPFEQLSEAIRAYLVFFDEHPELAELLIQERAQFRDGVESTYFIHQEADRERTLHYFSGLVEQGRVRDIPVSRIREVVGNLLFGTMLSNFLARRGRSIEEQVQDILDVALGGILSESERGRRGDGDSDEK